MNSYNQKTERGGNEEVYHQKKQVKRERKRKESIASRGEKGFKKRSRDEFFDHQQVGGESASGLGKRGERGPQKGYQSPYWKANERGPPATKSLKVKEKKEWGGGNFDNLGKKGGEGAKIWMGGI